MHKINTLPCRSYTLNRNAKDSIIIGIHCGHDASISVLKNGKNIFSVSEERFTHIKMYCGFPHQSLQYIFDNNIVPKNNNLIFASTHDFSDRIHEMAKSAPLNLMRQEVMSVLLNYGITNYIHEFFIHHASHASSAYYGMGITNDTLVITSDGEGKGSNGIISGSISIGKNGKIDVLQEVDKENSIGYIYNAITGLTGFKTAMHEGKITGLAAYGNAQNTTHIFNRIAWHDKGEIHSINHNFNFSLTHYNIKTIKKHMFIIKQYGVKDYIKIYKHHKFMNSYNRTLIKKISKNDCPYFRYWTELPIAPYWHKHSHEDWAAGVQKFSEDILCDRISYWVKKTGLTKVALAGGVFANVKINQRITERCGVDEIFIYPYMGDGGLAFGCACMAYYEDHPYNPEISRTETMYLGPEYSDKEILSALKADGKVEYTKSTDIAKDTADLIINRKIIGWFQGKMEFGPRALGNRSVVAMPDDPTINNWLNKRMQRTEFMPFAPSVLAEHMDDVFVIEKSGFKRASEYMTITYNVKPEWQDRIGAVNHVDNTARPQMVKSDTNPLYYDMIHHVYKQTGIPMIINTSFNVHEEPIVMTPDDALNALHRGMVDILAIGNYLVTVKG